MKCLLRVHCGRWVLIFTFISFITQLGGCTELTAEDGEFPQGERLKNFGSNLFDQSPPLNEYTPLTPEEWTNATRPQWTDPSYHHLKPTADPAKTEHAKARKSSWPEPDISPSFIYDFLEDWELEKDNLQKQGMNESQIEAMYDDFKANYYALPQNLMAATYVREDLVNHPIYVRRFYLLTGYTYSWEVTNLQSTYGSSPDTVMRLLRQTSSAGTLYENYEEIQVNDDGGIGAASKISSFTPTYNGWYTIIIHSYNSYRYGTFDLKFNGVLVS